MHDRCIKSGRKSFAGGQELYEGGDVSVLYMQTVDKTTILLARMWVAGPVSRTPLHVGGAFAL